MDNLSDSDFHRMINFLVNKIKNNQKILTQLHQEDNKVNQFQFDIQKLIYFIQNYKNQKVNFKNQQKVLIQHYGNPYITAMLCLESLQADTDLVIGIEDVCYGLNTAIINMFHDAFKENKVKKQIVLKNNLSEKEIQHLNLDSIICLGNSNAYMRLRKIKTVPVKHISLFQISLYYDNEEYEELAENIRYYANQNFYEIETFDETEDFEDVIHEMKHSENGYCAVILSKDKEKQQKFKQEIHAKIVCVNENPFHQFELKIPNEIF